jgi:hypothetical protein
MTFSYFSRSVLYQFKSEEIRRKIALTHMFTFAFFKVGMVSAGKEPEPHKNYAAPQHCLLFFQCQIMRKKPNLENICKFPYNISYLNHFVSICGCFLVFEAEAF